ncbi:hypothetical protein EK904_002852, partial [Melospiza melodia maxima]
VNEDIQEPLDCLGHQVQRSLIFGINTAALGSTPGSMGSEGKQGPPGIKGYVGAPGLQGERGEKGTRGDKGDRGLDGFPGKPGLEGKQRLRRGALLAALALLVLVGPKETRVNQDFQDCLALKESLGHEDHKATLDFLDLQESLVWKASLESLVCQVKGAKRENQDSQESMV